MIKRIAALVFIFVCTSAAWVILGATIFQRTHSSQASLRDNVISIWGAPHEQRPPQATFEEEEIRTIEEVREGKKVLVQAKQRVQVGVPLESSRVNVAVDLEHRQKGLLWYSTYKVAFDGAYRFRNPGSGAQLVTFALPPSPRRGPSTTTWSSRRSRTS